MTLYVRRIRSPVWHWRLECRLRPEPYRAVNSATEIIEWWPYNGPDRVVLRRKRPTTGGLCHWCARIEAREDREIAERREKRRKRA